MEVEILGIRHHGVGSAINTIQMLNQFQPDHIIIEGPAELMKSIDEVDLQEITPPIAILAYDTKDLSNSLFYPFAIYSPEWQGLLYAKKHNISIQMADMPLKHTLALQKSNTRQCTIDENKALPFMHDTPLEEIAKLEGYDDADIWWQKHFEESYYSNAKEHFDTIIKVMKALREHYTTSNHLLHTQRETFMKLALQEAKRTQKQKVAFICGAWHAPALLSYRLSKEEKAMIKGLPKTTVETSWIPWTNTRLSWRSGYGAGINAPGWYEHLWHNQNDDGKKWLVKVSNIFRKKDIDISTAHIIESYHLANALANMRGMKRATLEELNEAIISVMCMGDNILLDFITQDLIINKSMGKIPSNISKLPIQKDFEQKIKTYRLPLREDLKSYTLDLRTPRGLEKSTFLHRLNILQIQWATLIKSNSKGTFKEIWQCAWEPTVELQIIDKGIYGNTIESGAKNFINQQTKNSQNLLEVIKLLENAIVAKLNDSIDVIINQIDRLSTQSYEVNLLIKSVIPLIHIARYSDVRQSNEVRLEVLIENILHKIIASLSSACYRLDYDNSKEMFELISLLNETLHILNNPDITNSWLVSLKELSQLDSVSYLIQGSCYRILLDAKYYLIDEVSNALSSALSSSNDPELSAYWLEGFLKGSATLLLLDDDVWSIIYQWIESLDSDSFDEILPLLRRTFCKFSIEDRAKIGVKVKQGLQPTFDTINSNKNLDFDTKLAQKAIKATQGRLYAK